MMKEKISKYLSLTATAALLIFAAISARATTIEGYTSQGQFQTVLVTNPGRLQVDTSTGIPQHVISDSGSVSSVTVLNTPLPVSGNITVTASTAATITTGQITPTTLGVVVFAANSSRLQSNVCNDDPSANVWIGAAGVTTTSGFKLIPGRCTGPDVPASFQGALTAITTGTASANAVSFFFITP